MLHLVETEEGRLGKIPGLTRVRHAAAAAPFPPAVAAKVGPAPTSAAQRAVTSVKRLLNDARLYGRGGVAEHRKRAAEVVFIVAGEWWFSEVLAAGQMPSMRESWRFTRSFRFGGSPCHLAVRGTARALARLLKLVLES